jgi:hypothetical protein
MLTKLLSKVFDQGIRDWLSSRYNLYLSQGLDTQSAYDTTTQEANSVFGTNWKAK